MEPVDRALSKRAAEQLSVVGRQEALDLGMTRRQLDRRLSTGLLVPVHPGVYRMAAAPPSWEQAVMAACMAAGSGAVASHRSAAKLWGLRGVQGTAIEITVCSRGRRELRGVTVHRTARLDPVDRTTRLDVPVTTPARTLLDLGAVAEADVVESAMEDALLRGLVSLSWLSRTVDRLGRRGRNGAAMLRRLLEARDPSASATESPLEDRLLRLIRLAGLPEPVRQHEVAGVRLDLAYPLVKLGIEADSRLWHGGRADVQRNSDKANLLLAHGWRVLHFTWADVRDRGSYVAREVAAACPA